jgi:hypothetical protein
MFFSKLSHSAAMSLLMVCAALCCGCQRADAALANPQAVEPPSHQGKLPSNPASVVPVLGIRG